MGTLTDQVSVTVDSEPIPGYRLEERIGVGGYGEVWRALAPGGLKKAVKIVYGQIGDARAVRELKSLNRAKGLSHPFLLSLERIEIADGHLIIVTELADATLKDRFNQCREQGLVGIPRDELLQYMREAADALDYLFESYALQHLDVKPENLLMCGSHVKVADFGLMKDLQETCASFVNGLTPRYASPEMFEGKPGRHSDQYSLAILYQEMLSGELPFSGTNIAALASQHLNCAPDVSALSPLDRFAVGKALSKDPNRRFSSCREFVNRLMHRSSAILLTGNEAEQPSGGAAADESKTPSGNRQSSDAAHVHDGQTIQLSAPEIRSLPKLQLAEKSPTYRPTLFIGLGGAGGRTLARLRQLMADRLGEADKLAALQFLYIDTDMDLMGDVAAGPWSEGLRENEIVVMPLRQTQDYRSSSVSSLESISRRWIYNVPRSLRTQGLRALGRLALLDHSQRLLERLRTAVAACTDRESVAATSAESGLEFLESDPRVFVVSSITGGTGSGMVIDLGYAVRQVLAECGYSDDEVCAILSYSTAGGSKSCSFAPANAYALLDELRYFGQPGCDFPGERTCGLAGFREPGPTFKSTYLFDLGDNLTSEQFAESIDRISEYLFLNSVTPATWMFDECRRRERETPSPEPLRLRTAGICPFGAATREDPGQFAELLCKYLVRKWKVGIKTAVQEDQIRLSDFERLYEACDQEGPSNDQLMEFACSRMEELNLSVDGVSSCVQRTISEQLGSDPYAYLQNVIHDSLEHPGGGTPVQETPVAVAVRRLRKIIGSDAGLPPVNDCSLVSLRDKAMPAAQTLGCKLGSELRDWILELVDMESARVDGARQAVACVRERLSHLQQQAADRLTASKAALARAWQPVSELQQNPYPKRRSARKPIIAALEHYSQCLLHELVHHAVRKALAAVDPYLTSASDQLRELWKDLTQLVDEFHASPAEELGIGTAATRRDSAAENSRLAELFFERRIGLIQELDREIEKQFFNETRRLREVLTKESHLRASLSSRMRALARQTILQACREDSYRYLRDALESSGDPRFEQLMKRCFEQATPKNLALGGDKRLLVSAPGELDAVKLSRAVEQLSGEEASVACEENGDLHFCYEVENLPWEGVRTRLIRQRHDCQELAARLHTRINLSWTIV